MIALGRFTIFTPLVVLVAGCSAGGFYAGRAIDGDTYAVDTIFVTKEPDSSASRIRCSWDRDHLASLLENVQTRNNEILLRAIPPHSAASTVPRAIAQVELVTRYDAGEFFGSGVSIDTALVSSWPAQVKGWHGLFPGEPIVLTRKDAALPEITGNLIRLTAKTVFVWDGQLNRSIPLKAVKNISMSDGSIFSGEDLCSSFETGGLLSVPGFLLARPTYPLFFPLNQVEAVMVRNPFVWGFASTTLFVLGSVMDIGSVWALDSFGKGSDEEIRTKGRVYTGVYLVGDFIFAINQ